MIRFALSAIENRVLVLKDRPPCTSITDRSGADTRAKILNKLAFPNIPFYLRPKMPYVHITIHLRDGTTRSGVRSIAGPLILEDVRKLAWRLSAETIGHQAIEDVTVKELPPDDPAVVALIVSEQGRAKPIPRSDGTHPYVKQQHRRPPR